MSQRRAVAPYNMAAPVIGWVLIASAWLSVMAAMVIAPVLPAMTSHFSSVPNVDWFVSLAATLPALMVALFGLPMGWISRRAGPHRLLLWSVAFYGLMGIAPLLLPTLQQIVVSRAGVGLFEAVIMTCSTVLIGAYFEGRTRERYLALQTGTAPIVAVVAVAASGLISQLGWRAPFAIYSFAFVLLPVLFLLWRAAPHAVVERQEEGPADKVPFPIASMSRICVLTLFVMTAFLVTILQLPFLLTERGLSAQGEISFWTTIATLFNTVGALCFGLMRISSTTRLSVTLALMAGGFAVMGLTGSWQGAVIGAFAANLGAGMILPTLAVMALATLPTQHREVGTGAFMSANFLGQFLSPLAVLALAGALGGRSQAIIVYAAMCAIAAAGVLTWRLRRPKPTANPA